MGFINTHIKLGKGTVSQESIPYASNRRVIRSFIRIGFLSPLCFWQMDGIHGYEETGSCEWSSIHESAHPLLPRCLYLIL